MIRVEVVCALRDGAAVVALTLPAGSTVADALRLSGMQAGPVGIFGKVARPEQALRDGDRVELYRPLAADPKEARRRRAGRKP